MSAKNDVLTAISSTVELITGLETSSSDMTIAEIERLVADVRSTLADGIDALEAEYGVEAQVAISQLRDLAQKVQLLGERVIDEGTPLIEWKVPSSMPALLVAHILYGDLDREEELIRLNNLSNPNRIKANTVLKVKAS